MDAQQAIQNVLNDRFADLRRANSRYSLRAYATRVGVHVGALSAILNGKRNVSRELAERMLRKLMLDPQHRSELLRLFPEKRSYKKPGQLQQEKLEPRYLELSAAQFKVAAEWEHFAVMSLARSKDAESSPQWVAARLGISVTRAEQVLKRLIELELLTTGDDGRLVRSSKSYRTTDDVASVALKSHHDQTLELAKTSLHRDPVTVRDFTSTTMCIDRTKLSAAKEVIRKFHDDLSDLLESGHTADVFRLSVQLFPLSKLHDGDLK